MATPITKDDGDQDIRLIAKADAMLSRKLLGKIELSVERLTKSLFVSANTKYLSKMSVGSSCALSETTLNLALDDLKDVNNGVNYLTEIVNRFLNKINGAGEPRGEHKSMPANGVVESACVVEKEDEKDEQITHHLATKESLYIRNDHRQYANCVSVTKSSHVNRVSDTKSSYINCVPDTNSSYANHLPGTKSSYGNCVVVTESSNHTKSLGEQFIFDESNIKVVKELGRGNFAITKSVVLTSVEDEGTRAAWKVLKTDGKGKTDVEEYKKETMFLMMVGGQKNIMRFIGITLNVKNGNLGFLTELCERGSLDKLHDAFDLLEPTRFWKIVTGVFLGLMHLHHFKIVHRDVACRNILIAGDWTPKLSDFGLCVRATSDIHVGKVDERLPVFWVAPEGLFDRVFTHKSDVWAAGVTIWEILWKGKRPYIDELNRISTSMKLSRHDAMHRVLSGIVAKQIRLLPPPNTAPSFINLLEACLEFDPGSRPDAFQVLEHFVLPDLKANFRGGLQSVEDDGTEEMRSEKSRRAELATMFGVAHKVTDTSLDLKEMGLCQISRPVLMEIRKLTELTELNLNQNLFISLPSEIGELKKLTRLYMNQNQLTSLPAEIGKLLKLTELWELKLNKNQLTSVPVKIGELTYLKMLCMNENQLNSLPAEIGNLTDLKTLQLDQNQLTSLPTEIGKLKELRIVHLNQNRLTSLPVEIGKLTELEHLLLYKNKLTSLPVGIGNLTELNTFSVSNNRLTSLPAEICGVTNLHHLDLNRNQLTSLPATIGDLNMVGRVYLKQNQLISLPAEIGKLWELRKLHLNRNQLISLPREIGGLHNLEDLQLCENKLTSLPGEIGKLTKLKILHLDQNKLNSLTAEVGKLTNLEDLRLYRNKVTLLPVEIGKLTELTVLRLPCNRLTSLPAEIGELTKLIDLDLNRNKLTSLPSEIGKLTELMKLHLLQNQLTSLPVEIKKLTKLKCTLPSVRRGRNSRRVALQHHDEGKKKMKIKLQHSSRPKRKPPRGRYWKD